MALTLDGTNGIVSSGSITTQSATGVIFSDSSNQGAAASPFSLKNRIINGDMVISQRNGTSSVTPSTPFEQYILDRWVYIFDTASRMSFQQNAGSVTPPAGFTNYLGATTVSAYSVTSGNFLIITQKIEGFNIADLAWGTANARTVTLSFWVRSSLTGTFGGSLRNSDASRSYPFSYTISSANTWTQISITISGDTSGTWLTTNGIGLQVNFGLGVGSLYSGTAGSWASSNFLSATGATSVVGTNGATFYITGVQLERNTTATPFEWLPYGMELMLCQRYFYVIRNNVAGVQYNVITLGAFNATRSFGAFVTPVPLRANPTFTFNSVALRTPDTNTTANVTAIAPVQAVTVVPFPAYVPVEINVASGLTANVYYGLAFQASTNDFVALSAEL